MLIEALDDETSLPVQVPALQAWEQARFALLAFTGRDFGLERARTVRAAAATKGAWERWWAGAEESFEIVRPTGRFLR